MAAKSRTGLDKDDKLRATETIRVFGLNNSTLSGDRRRVLSVYKKRFIDDINELASWSEQDREQYFESEIETTRWESYATTIKHFLQSH